MKRPERVADGVYLRRGIAGFTRKSAGGAEIPASGGDRRGQIG